MIVVGLDLSNTYCGIAVVEAEARDDRPELVRLASVPGAGTQEARKTAARVHEVLDGSRPDVVWFERPPPSGSKGEHGRRLVELGYGLGWICGLTIGAFPPGTPCTEVQPGAWRDTMLERSEAWGVPASPPSDVPPAIVRSGGVTIDRGDGPGKYVVRYACGHAVKVSGGLPAVQARVARPCLECQDPRRVPDSLDWKTDEWKRIACALTAAHWPAPYEVLVTAARARARTNPPDHRLAGVHDACEAAWVAVHGLTAGAARVARRRASK